MKLLFKYICPLLYATAVIFPSCRDRQWDEHSKISDREAGISLLEALKENPECSQFYQAYQTLLKTTKFGDVLSNSNNYTVFVPANSAWQGVDMNDTVVLKNVVAYHIAYGKILANQAKNETLLMFNHKMIRYDKLSQSFNGAKINEADYPAGNGVFHIIDKVFDMKLNIWEYISGMNEYNQVKYIDDLNRKEMDIDKSISTGIDAYGHPVYDDPSLIVWMNVNKFLNKVPLDNESEALTYIVLKNEGFDLLYNKYHDFFKCSTAQATDSLTKFNVCQDFVFPGIIDITQSDTLTNLFGVKVPVKDANIVTKYDASNGRVYVIDKSNILLREKIKPVHIEGEDYLNSLGNSYIFIRNRQWASGKKDMVLSCNISQVDTFRIGSKGQDSIWTKSRSFEGIGAGGNGAVISNLVNFYIEYKAQVYSANYEIHYVAYDDISSSNYVANAGSGAYHIDRRIDSPPFTAAASLTQTLRVEQKMFVSMPERPPLRRVGNQIVNNYLGNDRCFVSQDTAGIHKERYMKQWMLKDPSANQYLDSPVVEPDAAIMAVDRVGELTMWLCNTARSNAASAQGMLFLDYIKLVPILPEE